MDIGPTELLVICVVVLVLFGGGRVVRFGGELGSAIRGFQRGLNGDDQKPDAVSSDSSDNGA